MGIVSSKDGFKRSYEDRGDLSDAVADSKWYNPHDAARVAGWDQTRTFVAEAVARCEFQGSPICLEALLTSDARHHYDLIRALIEKSHEIQQEACGGKKVPALLVFQQEYYHQFLTLLRCLFKFHFIDYPEGAKEWEMVHQEHPLLLQTIQQHNCMGHRDQPSSDGNRCGGGEDRFDDDEDDSVDIDEPTCGSSDQALTIWNSRSAGSFSNVPTSQPSGQPQLRMTLPDNATSDSNNGDDQFEPSFTTGSTGVSRFEAWRERMHGRRQNLSMVEPGTAVGLSHDDFEKGNNESYYDAANTTSRKERPPPVLGAAYSATQSDRCDDRGFPDEPPDSLLAPGPPPLGSRSSAGAIATSPTSSVEKLKAKLLAYRDTLHSSHDENEQPPPAAGASRQQPFPLTAFHATTSTAGKLSSTASSSGCRPQKQRQQQQQRLEMTKRLAEDSCQELGYSKRLRLDERTVDKQEGAAARSSTVSDVLTSRADRLYRNRLQAEETAEPSNECSVDEAARDNRKQPPPHSSAGTTHAPGVSSLEEVQERGDRIRSRLRHYRGGSGAILPSSRIANPKTHSAATRSAGLPPRPREHQHQQQSGASIIRPTAHASSAARITAATASSQQSRRDREVEEDAFDDMLGYVSSDDEDWDENKFISGYVSLGYKYSQIKGKTRCKITTAKDSTMVFVMRYKEKYPRTSSGYIVPFPLTVDHVYKYCIRMLGFKKTSCDRSRHVSRPGQVCTFTRRPLLKEDEVVDPVDNMYARRRFKEVFEATLKKEGIPLPKSGVTKDRSRNEAETIVIDDSDSGDDKRQVVSWTVAPRRGPALPVDSANSSVASTAASSVASARAIELKELRTQIRETEQDIATSDNPDEIAMLSKLRKSLVDKRNVLIAEFL